MDLDEYRKRSYKTWETMAPGWLRERDFMWDASRPVGEWLVAKLDPQPGQAILELAAGVGDTGFAAARELGDEGKLISTDFSPKMVEAARERAKELGISNSEHRVMDAEKMDLPDDSVDGVLCRWGYMAMADPDAAMRETRRVLRESGRLCFSVWSNAEKNPWAALPGGTLVQRGHLPAPEPGDPGIFSLADPDRLRSLVTDAGFAEPEIEVLSIEWRFDSTEEFWRFLNQVAGSVAVVIRDLPETERWAIRGQLEKNAEAFQQGGGYAFPGECLNIVAT
jgi:SAM-dependent methyltransferase